MNRRPVPFADPTFACDDMLGKLARHLRMIGYFGHYFHRIEDAKLVAFASRNRQVLLTRDTLIMARRELGAHLFVRSDHALEQLAQVVADLSLDVDPERFYSICLECNQALEPVEAMDLRGLVPPYVFKHQQQYSRCPQCCRIFWPATHRTQMDRRIRKALGLPLKEE